MAEVALPRPKIPTKTHNRPRPRAPGRPWADQWVASAAADQGAHGRVIAGRTPTPSVPGSLRPEHFVEDTSKMDLEHPERDGVS